MDLACNGRSIELRAPVAATYKYHLVQNGTIEFIYGQECLIDCGMLLNIGNNCELMFGHFEM